MKEAETNYIVDVKKMITKLRYDEELILSLLRPSQTYSTDSQITHVYIACVKTSPIFRGWKEIGDVCTQANVYKIQTE